MNAKLTETLMGKMRKMRELDLTATIKHEFKVLLFASTNTINRMHEFTPSAETLSKPTNAFVIP